MEQEKLKQKIRERIANISLTETRKEDDIYYQGPFWIFAESQQKIQEGVFEIKGEKIPVDYEGNYLITGLIRKGSTSHSSLWSKYQDAPNRNYTYYPRGRVRIVQGKVYIHLNSKVHTPRVVNAIVDFYGLSRFSAPEISVEHDDELQGSHYDFELV